MKVHTLGLRCKVVVYQSIVGEAKKDLCLDIPPEAYLDYCKRCT